MARIVAATMATYGFAEPTSTRPDLLPAALPRTEPLHRQVTSSTATMDMTLTLISVTVGALQWLDEFAACFTPTA